MSVLSHKVTGINYNTFFPGFCVLKRNLVASLCGRKFLSSLWDRWCCSSSSTGMTLNIDANWPLTFGILNFVPDWFYFLTSTLHIKWDKYCIMISVGHYFTFIENTVSVVQHSVKWKKKENFDHGKSDSCPKDVSRMLAFN